MIFIKNSKNEWLELNKETLDVFYYSGGYHTITQKELESSEILECSGWHELYKLKHYCPLEVDIKWHEIWISPDGKYYNGEAHENRAEEILEIIYNDTNINWFGDKLEQLGWIRACTNLMWEMRLKSDYWTNKKLTNEQFNALYEWCTYHNKQFPNCL